MQTSAFIIIIPIILVPPVPVITYESFTALDPNNATITITVTVSYYCQLVHACRV